MLNPRGWPHNRLISVRLSPIDKILSNGVWRWIVSVILST